MGEGGAHLVPGLWLERTEELGIMSEATCRGVRMGALLMTPSGPVEPGSAGGGGGCVWWWCLWTSRGAWVGEGAALGR